MEEKKTRYQKWAARVGVEEARRISLERCHRSRINRGLMSPDGPRQPLTREEKLVRRRAWAEKNRGHLRDYARAHYAKNADEIKTEMSERYRDNPEKWAAGVKARRAVKAGKIVKSDCCSMCSADGVPLEMHHTDYSKPLIVEWLCRKCHRRLHKVLEREAGTVRRTAPRHELTDEIAKQKKAARIVFAKALKAGEITKPDTCSKCGSDKIIEAHHLDYARPLDVEWLCRSCHRGLGHTQPRTKDLTPGSVPVGE